MKRYPFRTDKVYVSGHRGLGKCGIENTMSAFRMALDLGVDMIETDVHMSRDGALVLMHDETIDRTTDGTGKICDLMLEEIKKLDATVNATIDLSPEPPPTLNEFLALMREHPGVLLNVELKDYPEADREFAYRSADAACDLIIESGLSDRCWINSFSGELLEYVYKKHGSTFYYHGFYPWFILGKMEADPESFIDLACMQHRDLLDDGTVVKCKDNMCPKEWFEHLKKLGIMPLMAPSLKEYPLYDLAFSYGSRIVNPDDPEGMLEHLREMGLHE